jgi:hypothetical protein
VLHAVSVPSYFSNRIVPGNPTQQSVNLSVELLVHLCSCSAGSKKPASGCGANKSSPGGFSSLTDCPYDSLSLASGTKDACATACETGGYTFCSYDNSTDTCEGHSEDKAGGCGGNFDDSSSTESRWTVCHPGALSYCQPVRAQGSFPRELASVLHHVPFARALRALTPATVLLWQGDSCATCLPSTTMTLLLLCSPSGYARWRRLRRRLCAARWLRFDSRLLL